MINVNYNLNMIWYRLKAKLKRITSTAIFLLSVIANFGIAMHIAHIFANITAYLETVNIEKP